MAVGGGDFAFWCPRHKRFLRMHENGKMDRSSPQEQRHFPSGWTWERFKVVDLGRLVEKNRVELMLAFKRSVDSWLKSDPLNMALVYCDETRAASTVALACYFADCFEVTP